jgi:electron transport complex protein RnfC
MNLSKLFGKKTFPHGIHLEEHKAETNAKPTRRLPFAPEIIVPLAQHVGKPAKPLVFKGQHVTRGELIADADGFMSAPIHAPVTGTIKEIGLAKTAQGGKQDAIIITTSLNSGQQLLDSIPIIALGASTHFMLMRMPCNKCSILSNISR